MIWVADSSAVVKLYADEDGSELVAAQEGLVVSAVTRVEVVAALWRKVSTGELSTADAAVLTEEFAADWAGEETDGPRFTVVALAAVVLDAAADLVPVHRLRAYDAVVLATALAVRALESETGLLAWDRRLCDAAHREGLAVAP